MSYREIPKDKILKFPATPGFKGWKQFFTDESVSHPAKMNLNLLRWILETYTKPGEIVLDPMAGTGSTIVLASLLGRQGIAVEYEPRFCEMIRENIKRTSRQSTLTPKGRMTCIQGDARELSKLLGESDAIITSPPYSGRTEHRLGYDYQKRDEERGHKAYKGHRESYSSDPNNISNLPHGDIDSIVTSPPYEQTASSKQHGRDPKPHLAQGGIGCENINLGYSDDEDNIGNLKSESYLEAMLQVYRECWKVLKHSGKLILVTKNFIRDKKVVRLDLDTIKLCEAAGFRLSDRWYFKLPTRSFWRILYRRKYPDVPEVEYEDVLVFTKEAESNG